MSIVNVLHSKDAINSKCKCSSHGDVYSVYYFEKYWYASEKLSRNTLSAVIDVFRGRVGCLESIFSHDGTS